MAEPLVSIVVLSHARPALLPRALESVMRQTEQDVEVIVVDNHSDRSAEIAGVVAGFPRARLVASPVNLGFTGGMNLGLAESRGRYVLLSEDDIALPPECVATFRGHLERHPDVGVVTGMVVEEADNRILYAGGDVTLAAVWRMSITGLGETERGQFQGAVPVGYAPGCTLMAARELLQRLGGFRPDFFLYYEDAELAQRLKAAGVKIACLRQVKIRHRQSVSPGDARLVEFHKIKNLRALYLLHAKARVLPEFAVRYGVLELLRDLLGNPGRFVIGLKSRAWLLLHLPLLLRDRFRQRAGRRQL